MLRLQEQLAEAEAAVMPSRLQVETAKKRVKMAHRELCRVQSARGQRAATVRMLKAQMFQRLTTIQEREEARKVAAIQRTIDPRARLRPEYQTANSP